MCLKRDSQANRVGERGRETETNSEKEQKWERDREGERKRKDGRGEGGRRRKGEVTNIWGSSGRATRALIELYKSLILHPHFPHPAPLLQIGNPYSRDLPFAHSCLLFSREKY